MGAWGVGLYQDDVTCDIKEEYLDCLRVGKSNIEATQEMIDCNEDFINDADDGPLFWFALADTQWKYGRLLPEVKELALKYIHEGNDLKKWENTKYYEKRKKVLEDLEIKLNSPQPNERKVSKLVLKKAKWDVGDILLYKISDRESEDIKSSKWCDKYILFKIIGYSRTNVGSLPYNQYYDEQNMAVVLNWIGTNPIDIEKVDELEPLNWYVESKKCAEIKYIFSFDRNELKKLDFKVLRKSDNKYINKEDYLMDIIGICWCNIYTLDYELIKDLDNAEQNGVLVNEI